MEIALLWFVVSLDDCSEAGFDLLLFLVRKLTVCDGVVCGVKVSTSYRCCFGGFQGS